MAANTSLLVVFHGSRAQGARREAKRFCERLARNGEWERVAVAWVQIGEPTVAQALEDLAAAGAKRIVVAPMLVLPGRHLDADVPRLIEAFRAKWPGCFVALAPSLTRIKGFAELIGETCRRAADMGSAE